MSNVTLSNSAYDKLKYVTQIGLPALGSLYFGLSTIWGFPAAEEVVGSIALVTTFLGVLLGISSKNYNAAEVVGGQIKITPEANGKKRFSLEINGDPNDLRHNQKISFTVVNEDDDFWDPSAE